MLSEKEEVLKLIEALPDQVSLEEMLRELYIYIKFQREVQDWSEQRKATKVNVKVAPKLH